MGAPNLLIQDGDGRAGPVPRLLKPVLAQMTDVDVDSLGESLTALLVLSRLADGPAQGQQRSQDLLLPAGVDDGCVRVAQLGELLDRGVGQGEGTGGVEHEVTQQRVQAGQALGSLGAVKEALSHLARQPQTSSESGREGAVALEEACPVPYGLTQSALVHAVGEQGHELGEVLLSLDEDLDLTDRVRSAAHVVELEQCQGIGGVQTVEGQSDTAAGGAGPQVVGDDLTGGLLRDPSEGSTHIGQDTAGAVVGTGVLSGRVEAQVLGGHQNRGQGVQEGGLAGARGTGQQQARTGDGKVVVAVEGTPIVDLDPGETVLPHRSALESA